MPDDDTTPRPGPGPEPGRSPGYIPRPPSPADIARISEQQGMIGDEWAPNPPPAPGRDGPARDDPAASPAGAPR